MNYLFSQHNSRKLLVALTLGLFLLFFLPVYGVGAQENSDITTITDVNSSVVDINSSIEDLTTIVDKSEVVESDVMAETTETEIIFDNSNNDSEIVVDDEPNQDSELKSTKLNDEQQVILSQISQTLSNIQYVLAISDESTFETYIETLPIDDGDTNNNTENSFETLPSTGDTEDDGSVYKEMSFITLDEELDIAISAENNFNTLIYNEEDVSVSAEFNFITLKDIPSDTDYSISDEYSFVTLNGGGPTDPDYSISDEYSFVTLSGGGPTDPDYSISDEYSFVTLSGGGPTDPDYSISDEYSFVTLSGGGGGPTDPDYSISDEYSFVTLSGGGGGPTDPDYSISDEYSFVTLSGGGGGGGGSGGGGIITPPITSTTTPATPYQCSPYLKKFIKYGQNNDPLEVIKLQLFLRVFEGYSNVPISGIYDLVTFRAVEDFQRKYGRDVLKPWGITDSTGYVFITTTLAINSIYCGIDTANTLDLRTQIAREYQRITGEIIEPELIIIPPLVATTATSSVIKSNYLLSAISTLFDFIIDNFCWLLNLLLLLLIIFLLWLLLDQENKNNKKDKDLGPKNNPDYVAPSLSANDEDYLNKMADEEEKKVGVVSVADLYDSQMVSDDQLSLDTIYLGGAIEKEGNKTLDSEKGATVGTEDISGKDSKTKKKRE